MDQTNYTKCNDMDQLDSEYKIDHDFRIELQNSREVLIEKTSSKYYRVRDADNEKVAELVTKAKGPNRSLRKFASELGVSHNTIRRIIDMGNSTNCNNELIFKIAEHADPDSGVTLTDLLIAQGLQSSDTAKFSMYYMKLTENSMMNNIIKTIKSKGYSATPYKELYSVNTTFQFDGVLTSDAVGKEEGLWAFEFYVPSPKETEFATGAAVRKLDKIMAMLYRDELFLDKISLVVTMRSAFDQIVNRVKNYRISDEISIILLNDKKVEDEFIIPMKMRYTESIFKD